MTKFLTIFLLIVSCACFAQDDKKGTIKVKKVVKDTVQMSQDTSFGIYTTSVIVSKGIVSSVDPSFPGGDLVMKKFIAENITITEKESAFKKQKYGNQGVFVNDVYITFVVEMDGSLSNIKLLRATPTWADCDAEALRIVKMMPRWVPGQEKGKMIATEWMVEVRFSIK